ncbi:glycoside hydrolase family 20 protein [Pseudocercospora fijiensis CIRAD86]|uniref:beta-N-acetylhexosaminidase n=1 Tax=Pseudocercospora fijiensis (strain CIRAD86) TaxID=383855 RepID=M3AZX1_PSEFD|nr:glycoside hydrolase family 20 protein [Pseudocercospora fijiensis CIRAD86]EME82708.1 glycoside hydrolase family 20 protein [Pseudocercospora fijiensis CIRAD86]
MALFSAVVSIILFASSISGTLLGVPTVPFTGKGSHLDLRDVKTIVVDTAHGSAKDQNGQTLIPPTLDEFAETFAKDWLNILGSKVSLKHDSTESHGTIFLTLGNRTEFKDAAGRWTSEAYSLEVRSDCVKIVGASPLGVWWGTRSVLQQAALHDGIIETGSGVDSPGWGTRGVMFDGGRHYYPPEFIIEMCSWMSFYKQNVFHLHLSDNLYNNIKIYSRERQLDLYARFRLWSEDEAVKGLNKHKNESYTRSDFDHMQSSCAARGVTIIPEIEAPGHALVFSQFNESLGLSDDLSLLNLTNPYSTEFMKTVWKTFLPWFQSKVVHIGADEYVDDKLTKTALAEVYNDFVNEMNKFIPSISGKEVRIWGTFPPSKNYSNNIATEVSLQHWEFFEDNPYYDYIKNGYRVVNSDDHNYIVQKYSTSYPQQLNHTLIFHGNPEGGAFAPNIFDPNNATNNPPKDNPFVLGHLAAQWNDYGANTSTYLEAYYPWRAYLPALADKQWGGEITEDQYDQIYDTLQSAAPAQNLDRRVPSKTRTIFSYIFPPSYSKITIPDLSQNNYDAQTNCQASDGALQIAEGCKLSTPLTSKGGEYTLSFKIKQTSKTPGPIFTGPDSELRSGNGTSDKVMIVSAGNAFALNYSLPVGDWVDAALVARGNRTFFRVDGGKQEHEFLAIVGVNGERFAWAPLSVVAPIQTFGGGEWEGELKDVMLVNNA